MHPKLAAITASALLATGSPLVAAQQQDAQQAQGQGGGNQGNVPPVSQWDYSQLYEQGGVRGEALLEADVIGRNGEDIGEVANVIFNDQNQSVGILAEVGGIWDISDRHVAIPFGEVQFASDGVRIPLTEENVDEFELFGDNANWASLEQLQSQRQRGGQQGKTGNQGQGQGPSGRTPASNWRLTSLIDDYAVFPNGDGYGYVEDVLISRDGMVQAVIVQSETGAFQAGSIAVPFDASAQSWQPGKPSFTMPYGQGDVGQMGPFRINQYDGLFG